MTNTLKDKGKTKLKLTITKMKMTKDLKGLWEKASKGKGRGVYHQLYIVLKGISE